MAEPRHIEDGQQHDQCPIQERRHHFGKEAGHDRNGEIAAVVGGCDKEALLKRLYYSNKYCHQTKLMAEKLKINYIALFFYL